VKVQLIRVRFWFICWFHALVSSWSDLKSGNLRVPRHSREYRLNSISA
jgi:hypothetical protein